MVVFNFSVLEPLNVNILMCQSPDESILKKINFFSHGKVIFDRLDIPGSRRVHFGKFQLFRLGTVRFDNLDVPGPRQVNFEIFQLFGVKRVKCENLPVPGSRRANFENFQFFWRRKGQM